MSEYYVYLISSLPMISFGQKPPFSSVAFLERCRELIPEGDSVLLERAISGGEQEGSVRHTALTAWLDFERSLRNELVKIRASRKKVNAGSYLRSAGYVQPFITQIAMSAHKNPSPLASEQILDEARWRYLDSLSGGHYFDVHVLIVYALKLVLLEKWERIRSVDKQVLTAEAFA